ncbi:TolC family protein [Leeia sp. TBRC 13508]|uniref:TolC family protein n=1 Tax=Leeia speluncae TaxID=2884804 RepID=A0ABS8D9T5_9NEIS|nr:TolC family protein [Leeia speluncae]MCB6184892.1 TolC family protein [Leeia speluncae]
MISMWHTALKRPISVISVGLVSSLLAACASQSVSDILEANLSAPSLAAQQRYLAEHPELKTTAKKAAWWHVFNDETLNQLVDRAIRQNLDLKLAFSKIDESRAILGWRQSANEPQVAFNASYARAALSEYNPLVKLGAPTTPTDTWATNFSASWELDLWGYKDALEKAANARLLATELDAYYAQTILVSELTKQYQSYRWVQKQLSLLNEKRKLIEAQSRLSQSRIQNGVTTSQEQDQWIAAKAELTASINNLQHQENQYKNALTALIGEAPHSLDDLLMASSTMSQSRELAVGIPSEWVSKRPDVLRAEAQLRASLADTDAANADFYPRISLVGTVGVQAFDRTDLGNWNARHYAIGPTFHLPIFDGGRLKTNLAISEVHQKQAAINYQKTVLNAWHEVDDALDSYHVSIENLSTLENSLAAKQHALQMAKRNVQQGAQPVSAILNSQNAVLDTEILLNAAKLNQQLSINALYRAIGGSVAGENLTTAKVAS